MVITFDDGLKEQYEKALPILAAKGVPFIFFVGATYRDDLVRTPDGWRISRRVEADAWMKDLPTSFTPVQAQS